MNTEKLLEERQSTHGSFTNNAEISQDLKSIIHSAISDLGEATPVQKEAIDMICLKLSRIASGQAHFKDHWDDISGYATLAANELEHDSQKTTRN